MGFEPTTLLVLPSSPYMDDSLHLSLFPFGCNTNISSINSLSVPEKVLNTSDPLAFKSQLESCLGLYLKVVSKSTENSIFMGLTCFSILSTPCKHQSQESFDSVRVVLCERNEKNLVFYNALRTSFKEQKTPEKFIVLQDSLEALVTSENDFTVKLVT